jgi:hypothetical protein
MIRENLAARQRILGRKHPSTLTSLGLLAAVFYCKGNSVEAELYRESQRAKVAKVDLVPGADPVLAPGAAGNVASHVASGKLRIIGLIKDRF